MPYKTTTHTRKAGSDMDENTYYGRPVRAVRFKGENLSELAGILPHSRAEVTSIVRTDTHRRLWAAARVWTEDRSLYVPSGEWLIVEQDGQFLTLDHEDFVREYNKSPDGAGGELSAEEMNHEQ